MRTYLLVETEKMPVGHRGLLTTFHGIFDNLDAAKQGLRTVAEALLINPQIGDRAVRGKLVDGSSRKRRDHLHSGIRPVQ